MVSFGFSLRRDPTAPDPNGYPPDRDPYLYVWIPKQWRARHEVTERIKREKPNGFTDLYPPGDEEENTPVWKYLHLEDFATDSGFDTESLIQAVVKGFTDLLPLRHLIDEAVQEHPLGQQQKRSTAKSGA